MKNHLQNWHNPLPVNLMLLNKFRFKGVIDWMKFCVTLHSPSQFRHVQDRMREVWGKVHFSPDQGTASSLSFTFRLNDPPGPEQFMRELQSMARPGDPPIREKDVVVKGIEISLDAYLQGSNRQALAEAVAYFIRHQANPPAGSPRITATGLTPIEPASVKEVLDALLQGGITINAGVKDSNWTCRYYLKDYDSINGVSYVNLPPELWRARFENTLQGSEVLFTSINGWRECRFEKVLADRFALVVPDSDRSPLVALMQDYLVQLGRRPDSPKRRNSDRCQRRPYTRRDSVMNDKIRQALRALTRAQSCQNSVSNPTQTLHSSLGSSVFPGLPPLYGITSISRQSLSEQHLSESPGEKSLLTNDLQRDRKLIQVNQTKTTGRRSISQGDNPFIVSPWGEPVTSTYAT